MWDAPSYLEEGPAPETRVSPSLPASGGTPLALLAVLRWGVGRLDAGRPGRTATTRCSNCHFSSAMTKASASLELALAHSIDFL
jgi:hypothetical protein